MTKCLILFNQLIFKHMTFSRSFNNLAKLPPDSALTESLKIVKQLVKTSAALAELKGMSNLLPNPNILLNAVVLREARLSSEIENVITTQDKLYQAISTESAYQDESTKEVLRYREAMLFGLNLIKAKGFLNTNGIINIQEILEGNSAGLRKLPGTALRNAKTGAVIYTPPDDHEVIQNLMRNLENYFNETDELNALIRTAIQHYQFESIHPFYDGNGRTGRILNILHLVHCKIIPYPILFLSGYIMENKTMYYLLLQEVRTKNNWEGWILYMLKGMEESAKNTILQINQINTLFGKITEKVKNKNPKIYSRELIEILFEQPYCRSEHVERRMEVSRPTAAKYLKDLEASGIVESRKIWKNVIYINTALFKILKEK